ncbi:hypothetical protein [Pseudonocardia xishanensis]|uniref:hypothetical protein n=1 Tax=Pseudonocardia xishanensis TaxID=630995 RepID=UPI0031EEE496
MRSDLRLDPAGLEAAAVRAAALADELTVLARRADRLPGLEDLPESLAAARTALNDAASVLRSTSSAVAEADGMAARGFRGLR